MFEQFFALVFGKAISLFLLAILNIIMGVVVAVMDGTFKWEKIAEGFKWLGLFLVTWLIAEVLTYMAGVVQLPDGFGSAILQALGEYTGTGVFLVIALRYVASIVTNIAGVLNVKRS